MSLTALLMLALCTVQAESPRVELLNYDLHLVVRPESREVVGRATVELLARGGPLETLRFALNAGFELDEVREGKRKLDPLQGDRIAEGRAWTVRFVPPLKTGERRSVHFEYHGQGVDPGSEDPDWMGVVLVREDEIRMSHQSQWYPIVPLDDRARAKLAAPTTLELVLPRRMESLGPGELEGTRLTKAAEVHRWVSRRAVRPSIVAGRYQAQVVKAGKQRVRVLSTEAHRQGAKLWAEEAARVLDVFRRVYGDLGQRTYGLSEMHVRNRLRSYNYEADGFSVYDGVLFDGRVPDTRKIAHEVAHLWFGASVDSYGPGERFLVESTAEAAAFVYLEEREGARAASEAAALASQRYFQASGEESAVVATDFASPRYVPVIYGKGALALRSLRSWMGDVEFDAALRGWIADCMAGTALPSLGSFLASLRAAGGEVVDTWASDWLQRPGFPKYSLEYETEPEGGQRTRVTGFLIQEGELYHNPVELGLVSDKGRTSTITVTPRDGRMRFEAVVSHTVERVELDPNHLLLIDRD
jgi:hypothetical protein